MPDLDLQPMRLAAPDQQDAAKRAPNKPARSKTQASAKAVPLTGLALRPSLGEPETTGAITAPGPSPQTAPGNAIIAVDPSADVVTRTNETADPDAGGTDGQAEPDAGVATDRAATPGQAPTGAKTSVRSRVPVYSPQSAQPAQSLAAQPSAMAIAPARATAPSLRSTDPDPPVDAPAKDFEPIGLRAGSFTWRPAVELSVGATTNVQAAANGTASSALRVAPELVGESDWSRHALKLELHGSLTDYPSDPSLYRPTISAQATGRIDVSDGVRIDLKAGIAEDRLPGASASAAAGTTTQGYSETLTGSAGITRDLGLIALTLRGDFDRTTYQTSTTTESSTVGPESVNSSHYVAALRGTYSTNSALKPFVELQLTGRTYDAPPPHDSTVTDPPNRDSTGYAVKSGAVIDFGPRLSGEAAIGYGSEKAADSSLTALRAMTTDASLVWSPTRLTRISLTATTAFEPALVEGASGAVARTAGLKVTQDLTRSLTAELGGSMLVRTYTGISRHEDLASLTAGLTWKLNRNVQTFVRGSFDRFTTTADGSSYTAATVFAGIRLQQ